MNRWWMQAGIFLVGGLMAGAANIPEAPEGFALKGDAAKGAAVYKQYCAMCHGDLGKGDGIAAAALNPKPRNLADKELMGKVSDWEVYLVIKEGGAAAGLSPMMTSWKAVLSDEQIHDVATYVRSLAK